MNSRYEAILAAVPDIIMEVDTNRVYTWANQAGLDFFGADVIGKEASYYFEGEQKTYELVKDLFEGDEKVVYVESWQRRRDNEKRLLTWWCRVSKDADGKVIGAVSTARDITEQRSMEERLQFQNQLFENTIESLNHPFYVIDVQDYTIKIANKATAIFGTISEHTTCYALTHNRKSPCRGTKHVCPLERIKSTKKPVKFEHIHYDKNGKAMYFEVHGFPIIDEYGNIVQMIEYTLDITIRRQMQEALKKSHTKLESRVAERTRELKLTNKALRAEFINHKKAEKARIAAEHRLEEQRAISIRSDRLRSLGQMAAGIAHELNQPLVGVRGLAEHLLIGLNRGWVFSEDKLREKFSLIIEQADRMSHIIEHVRLFAREAGKPEMHQIDVNQVVTSALDMLGAQLHSKGIITEANLCQHKCKILANPFSLEEVFLNLMINARDAVEEKVNRISILAAPKILLCTSIEQSDFAEFVQIQVIDNGIGIEAGILPKIFDPFFTTKEPDKGTGLGLAISKSIIEQFNGKIEVQSVHRQGTTITIIFPIAN